MGNVGQFSFFHYVTVSSVAFLINLITGIIHNADIFVDYVRMIFASFFLIVIFSIFLLDLSSLFLSSAFGCQCRRL